MRFDMRAKLLFTGGLILAACTCADLTSAAFICAALTIAALTSAAFISAAFMTSLFYFEHFSRISSPYFLSILRQSYPSVI